MYRRGVQTMVERDALARFGYALSDATRARILLSLRESGRYPSDLADEMEVSRQIVSNHLACLRGCGLVVAVPEGRRSRYELADVRIAHALDDLVGLVLAVDPACCPSSTEGCCCPRHGPHSRNNVGACCRAASGSSWPPRSPITS